MFINIIHRNRRDNLRANIENLSLQGIDSQTVETSISKSAMYAGELETQASSGCR